MSGGVLHAAVLGSPVAHSLSPVLHRAAYRALGLTQWRYAAHEVDVPALAPFVAGLDETWRGLSLTMPLKEAALDLAATVSATAATTGAANTLVRSPQGGWDAHNTDVHGIEAALGPRVVEDGAPATVLGSGATARSALAALQRLGVRRVRLAVRGEVRPQTAAVGAALGLELEQVALAQWPDAGSSLVVSTLPPAASGEAAAALGGHRVAGATLLDVVYADWPTPLARAAAATGFDVVPGIDMLVHQAAAQVELMTGLDAPVEAMREAAEDATA
ncbi:MAG TPA: shikimate dehydrogenase [Pedococcus sp.]